MSRLELPDELDFHLAGEYPGENLVELKSDPCEVYAQLVCWCLIQRFWYYILHTPQVSDTEYDEIENLVRELEETYPYSLDHPYSPTKKVGSESLIDYPPSIYTSFFCVERLGCSIQQYRLNNK